MVKKINSLSENLEDSYHRFDRLSIYIKGFSGSLQIKYIEVKI